MTICLFGGARGSAPDARKAINSRPGGLVCVGALDPGFGSVEQLSNDEFIDRINASGASFLAVSLGAVKGQAWLKQNHHRLQIPIRAHLGAAVNFQSGMIKRAPLSWQKWGLEWLWRVKEEPYLWKRYATDGAALIRLLITRVLPLVIFARWRGFRSKRNLEKLSVETWEDNENVIVRLSGAGTERHVEKVIVAFFDAVAARSNIVVVDIAGLSAVDARFLGLCLMLRKRLNAQGTRLAFRGASPTLSKLFRLHGVGFLLTDDQGAVDAILPPRHSAVANAS
jgi:N-acetylglucosaminyldiphosphoundecaprenol N-acetyl-beta-D-mannosaminyltransferase